MESTGSYRKPVFNIVQLSVIPPREIRTCGNCGKLYPGCKLGRTHATEGQEVSRASLTGFDYTDVPPTFAEVAFREGPVIAAPEVLISVCIPAHTIVVAFGFPDYHAVAKVARMIALGTILLADGP